MKPALKALFRPAANRHYSGKKANAVIYAFQLFPAVLVGLYGAAFVDALFWVILGGVVV